MRNLVGAALGLPGRLLHEADNLRILAAAGMLRPIRPDKLARIALNGALWRGSPAALIVIGAVLGSFSTSGSPADLLSGPYTALPVIVYDWARKPQEEFRALTSAAILVLLGVTVLANTLAILLRNRYERRW